MKHNVLISSAGQRVSLVRGFKETIIKFFPKAKVYTTDVNPKMAPAGYVSDGCFEVPHVTALNYINQLLDLCKANNVGMIIPTIDTELFVLSQHKDLFDANGITISVSSYDFIRVCRDKRNLGDFFEKHNIRVPKPIDKHNPTFPLFAKPYDGSLSINLHHIRTQEELTTEILEDPKLLFMEYIDTNIYEEYTVDMYYGRDNRVKCIVPRERIKVRAGEINKGRTKKNEIVDYLKERLDYIPGCFGCICIQLFYHPETKDIVGIEINPRFGGGYPLTYMSGANFPELLIREYLLDEDIEYFKNWKDGILMLRFDDAIYIVN